MPKKHFLTEKQLESLTSPTRLAIVQRLEIDKEATAREIANRMGRSVTSLYHHLKQLEDVGVLRVVSVRKGPRRPEAVYAIIADYLSSSKAVKSSRGRKSYARAVARVADAAARTFSAAVAHGNPRFEGASRNSMVRYFVIRADKKKLSELNKLLIALEDAAAHSSEKGEEIRLTVLLSANSR